MQQPRRSTMKNFWKSGAMTAIAGLMLAGTALAQSGVSFKDPTGDDNGPGKYTYPTDGVYKRGSFDMTAFDVKVNGKKVDFAVTFNTSLEDPWRMGGGFSVQMAFVLIKTGDGGVKEGPPGTNVTFADGNEWNKLVILSPQPLGKVKSEVDEKMKAQAAGVVIPTRVKGSGQTISGSVDLDALGGGD